MVELNEILQIPERCLVNRKITKAFFKRNFDLTSAEKSLLEDFSIVKSIDWLASVSPANANIPAYNDAQKTYEEIVIINISTVEEGFDKNKHKLAELVQKYIPYSILLCISMENAFCLNACEKKVNQNDSTRRTIETRYFTDNIYLASITPIQESFLDGLGFANLDKTNLKSYYDSYIQCIVALKAAEISNLFIPRSKERTETDLQNLEKIESLQKEIITLQNSIGKETQLNQRVQFNIDIQRKRKEIEHLKTLIIV